MLLTSLLMAVAIAGFDDCNGDAIPDWAQPCLDCDDNGLLDSCEADAFGGLVGQYWSSVGGPGRYTERLAVRIDETIDFNWGDGAPGPDLPANDFSVRWTGALTPPVSGTYDFITTTDDGVRLWVDGVLLIDRWVSQPPTERTGSITLEAGVPVVIRMDYFEAGGGATARLEWRPPGADRQVIPVTAMHPSTDLDGDGAPDSCGDCNGNGIADSLDLLDGTSFDCNDNCVPDECDVVEILPQGYWRFEEGGGAVIDSGPNGLDGSPVDVEASDDVPVTSIPLTAEFNARSLEVGGDGYVLVEDPAGQLTAAGSSF
ncbi:MAG: PA14 domain-containing protein, partial [Planctomycetota bacterium]